MINMIYADILSLMDPLSPIRRIMGGTPAPSGGLIIGAVLMEAFIVMIVLSRILPYKANRWVTTFVFVITLVPVVKGGHGLYYAFFASIEVGSMILILWLSWKKPYSNSGINVNRKDVTK